MERLHTASLFAIFCRSNRPYLSLSVLLGGVLLPGVPGMLHAQAVTFTGTAPSVDFGKVNLCAGGKTTPAPCSETLTLTYKVTAGGTLGPVRVVTGGVPDLDFTLAGGSTCTGSVTQGESCIVKATFTPRYVGLRPGAVQIVDASNTVLATTFLLGLGEGPQIGFDLGTPIALPLSGGFLPDRIATDAIGNLFVSGGPDPGYAVPFYVLRYPADGGPQITLPFKTPDSYGSPVVDGAGDVIAFDYTAGTVVELPAGGGAQFTLPFDYAAFPPLTGFESLTVDGRGNVFLVTLTSGATASGSVVELPAGGGKQITLPFSGLSEPTLVATDYAGDVFVQDSQYFPSSETSISPIFELPGGTTPQKTLTQAPSSPEGLAVDGPGDVFTSGSLSSSPTAFDGLVELPAGTTAVIPLVTNPNSYVNSMAVGLSGDVYFIGNSYLLALQRSQPPPLDFGEIPVESTTSLPLTLQNTGTSVLTVTPVFDTTGYSILSTSPAGCLAGIAAAQTCTLQIQFAPVIAGPQSGLLTLQTNGLTNPAVPLTGTTGVATPILSAVSGVYSSTLNLSVSITDATPGAGIYYTTDGTVPTSSSTKYTAPISIASTARLNAIAAVGSVPSAIATAAYIIVSKHTNDFNYSNGFVTDLGNPPIYYFGSTQVNGPNLELTGVSNNYYPDGLDEAGGIVYTPPVNIQAFMTEFIFQLTNAEADGFTFTIQKSVPTYELYLGDHGAGLGYAGIPNSVALKFDLHNDSGEGSNSTGLYINGADPTVPSISLSGSGINLHNGDSVLASLAYDGANLSVTLTDLVTLATWSHSFAVDIPTAVGSPTAMVGFTAGTGKETAIQQILAWTFVSGTPVAPAPAPPPSPSAPALPYYPSGFVAGGTVANGSASRSSNVLQLTDGQVFEAGSAFYANRVNIQSFTTDFSFQQTGTADGMTFTIQNAGVNALGNYGGSLGYAPMGKSVALKLDIHNNQGEGQDSTGLYVDGALPTLPATDLANTGIYLQSGYPFAAHITYDGVNLSLTLTNQVTRTTWSQSFPIDIPATVGGSTAFVGFTGGTGTDTAVQQISNWSFTNP